jgi:hypothetical protein
MAGQSKNGSQQVKRAAEKLRIASCFEKGAASSRALSGQSRIKAIRAVPCSFVVPSFLREISFSRYFF